MIVPSVVTALGVAALLFCERAQSRIGVWLFKPLASTAFVALALSAGAFQSAYGTAILAGLVLSWFGDVFLIPLRAPKIFLAGVLSFLLGHVAYVAAFVGRGLKSVAAAVAALFALIGALVVLRWLMPHVRGGMRAAVLAYVVVISLMVVCAVATYGARGNEWIVAGAVGFYLSDLSVARDRFVAPGFVNKAWGLPLYYGGQILLAWSIHVEGGLSG